MKKAFLFASLALAAAVIFTGCKKDEDRDPATYGVAPGTYDDQMVILANGDGSPIFQQLGTAVVAVEGKKKVMTISVDGYTFKLTVKDNDMIYGGKVSMDADEIDFDQAAFMNLEGAKQTIKTGVTASFGGIPTFNTGSGVIEACLTNGGKKYNGAYMLIAPRTEHSFMFYLSGTATGLDGSQTAKPVILGMMSNNII